MTWRWQGYTQTCPVLGLGISFRPLDLQYLLRFSPNQPLLQQWNIAVKNKTLSSTEIFTCKVGICASNEVAYLQKQHISIRGSLKGEK